MAPHHHRRSHAFRPATVLLAALGMSMASLLPAQPPPPPPPLAPLGPAPVPPGNPITPAKTNLGKALFWEEQLSSTRTVSCGTCHQPASGGSDVRSKGAAPGSFHPGFNGFFGDADDVVGSQGVPQNQADGTYSLETHYGLRAQVTGRKAPTYLNAAYPIELFWDGRATPTFRDPVTNAVVLQNGGALESQAVGPPLSDVEMAHVGCGWDAVIAGIATARPLALASDIPAPLADWIAGRTYPELFAEAFGTPEITASRIAMAIATHERTLSTNQTPLDAALTGGPPLTAQEERGRTIFTTRNCITCHNGPLLSDNSFRYIGVRPVDEDLGRFAVTNNPADRGAFRTPGLRNVELRGPYFHNGRFQTLEEVVDFYNRGGDFNAPNKAPQITPLNLNAGQRADLVAFLRRPLTDPRVAAGQPPFDRPRLYTESAHVPAVSGAGVAGSGGMVPTAIAIEPPIAGNPSFTIAVADALGGAMATLVIDDADPGPGPELPATASFARESRPLAGAGPGMGHVSIPLAVPNAAAQVGRTYHGRWYIEDSSAPGGVAASRAFSFTIFGIGEAAQLGFTGIMVR